MRARRHHVRQQRQHGIEARGSDRLVAGMQPRAEHAFLPPVVQRLEEQRRVLRAAVDRDDRARLDDPGEIEELIVLAERLFTGTFGGAL